MCYVPSGTQRHDTAETRRREVLNRERWAYPWIPRPLGLYCDPSLIAGDSAERDALGSARLDSLGWLVRWSSSACLVMLRPLRLLFIVQADGVHNVEHCVPVSFMLCSYRTSQSMRRAAGQTDAWLQAPPAGRGEVGRRVWAGQFVLPTGDLDLALRIVRQ